MTNSITRIVKFATAALFIFGISLLLKNKYQKEKASSENLNSKALVLKKYLLQFQKPQRIELTGLSNRYARDIKQLKNLKISQDPNSDFYITIQLFSDETDKAAPLIAQIRFVDLKTGNSKKEESINLE